MLRRKGKAQSTTEYAVLFAIVAAAVVGMQVYMKRSVQGRMRQSADSIGSQYEPGNTTSTITLNVSNTTTTTTTLQKDQPLSDGRSGDTVTTITNITNDTTTRSGDETVGPLGTSL